MADTPQPTGGRERVAFDLYILLRAPLPAVRGDGDLVETAKAHLDLYAECLKAVRGEDYDTSKLKQA